MEKKNLWDILETSQKTNFVLGSVVIFVLGMVTATITGC